MTASSKNDIKNIVSNTTTINSIEFARKALKIHDTIAPSRLLRLHDILATSEGLLDYRIIGGSSQEGQPLLQLFVQGCLQLCCQRCLETFEFELNIASNFFLVSEEKAIPSPEEGDDDRDYLVADTQMQVLDLIEDEILLALPLAPKHEAEHCGDNSNLNELKSPNPFAVLESLKMGKDRIN